MRDRTKVLLASLAGAAAIHGAMVACSEMRFVRGDASGERDAHAPQEADAQGMPPGQTASGACSLESTTTQVAPDGVQSTTTTNFYAEIPVPGLNPESAPQVATVLCDFERSGPQQCPAGWTCEATGYQLPSSACTVSHFATSVRPGFVIVQCGTRIQQVVSAGIRSTYISRARRATVVVR